MALTPYYEAGGITIYHGDCREVMPGLDPVDLVLTDPPYNVGIEYGAGTDDSKDVGAYREWCESWFRDCVRLAPAVALTPGIVNVSDWCWIARPKWIIAWHKPAAMGRSPFGFCNWEPVLFYGKAAKSSGVDVITAAIKPSAEFGDHPCPKPVRWGTALIELLTHGGATVMDPFMGSGTTLRAAKDIGRKAIGIEIEERYCEIAAKRMGQGMLFSEVTK